MSGVNEFKIEVIPLSISVSANANKNAGIKVPTVAEIAIHFHDFESIFFMLLIPIKKRNNAAKTVLNAPNCKGDNPISAFLISINELPHIKDKTPRKIHFSLTFGMINF